MFKFGKRKILAVHYTRYVSLPKEWLRNHDLEKGDKVEILLTDEGNLLIKPGEGENNE